MRLNGKVAIVTGAARGIGRAVAERFAAEGARVVVSDIDAAAGRATADAIGAHFHACDVGDRAAVDALVGDTVSRFGALDAMVANAGIVHAADFLDIAEADFDRVLRVNLKGAFLCGQAAARVMVGRVSDGGPAGAIVNMSSVNAELAIPNQVPYCVSKGGIAQLTNVMALALAPHRIRVNAVGPGSIATEMLAQVAKDRAARMKLLSRTPLGRLGEPAEIAAIVAFLVSDDASYVTGQTIFADGGRLGLNYTVPVPEDA